MQLVANGLYGTPTVGEVLGGAFCHVSMWQEFEQPNHLWIEEAALFGHSAPLF
jgi:hypothetical protein